jgi:hypothetical protein
MAKRIVLESYSFDKVNKIVTINNRYLRREQLILITNIDKNTVIYNFADTTFSIDTWETSVTPNAEYTKITLKNTGNPLAFDNMSNTDKLSILVEETNESFQPDEARMDPVGKLRVSTPQSLIDTDFEYGPQPTKWETVGLVNNRPSAYYDPTVFFQAGISNITATNASRTVTVSLPSSAVYSASCTPAVGSNSLAVTSTAGLQVGMYLIAASSGLPLGAMVTSITSTTAFTVNYVANTTTAATMNFALVSPIAPIYIQDTTVPMLNGWTIPTSVTYVAATTSSFTYTARENFTGTTGNVNDTSKTYIYPGYFFSGAGIPVSTAATVTNSFTNSGTIVSVTTLTAHGLSIGQGIYVTNLTATTNPPNGAWIVKTTPTANTFTYEVINAPTGTIVAGWVSAAQSTALTLNVTSVSGGTIVSIGGPVTAGTNYNVGDIVPISTGTGGLAKILSITGGGVVNQVGILHAGTASYTTGTLATTAATYACNVLFPRSWGTAVHRAFDGGVSFSAGLPYHGNQTIRQTRRYFRYQSGKGIQFNTGTNMCSPFQLDSIVVSGTNLVTVTTKYSHNLYMNNSATANGPTVRISGAGAPHTALNGDWVVTGVTSDTTFTFSVSSFSNGQVVNAAGGSLTVQPYKWYGASTRIGMFDQQNGFFFQYDGANVSVNRRSSTYQLPGAISNLCCGSATVTGVGSRWNVDLVPYDFIVIRGQSYMVLSIESATSMTICPEYKGTAILAPTLAVISKTVDYKVNQASWNIDKCDGTGASGFNLDISKMQMWMMDYSWYGAGAIRFGFKNQRGEIMYVHRMAHGNQQTEAFMRSGNLPARYEVNTFWPVTKLVPMAASPSTFTLANNGASFTVSDATGFPPAGYVTFSGHTTASPLAGAMPTIEYVKYTSLTGNVFSGLTRGCTVGSNPIIGPGGLTAAGGSAATTYDFTNAPCAVSLWAPQSSTTLSHWGSAVVMDGRFDDDKAFIFNYGNSASATYATSGTRYPVFSIRLAPSVDAGLTGLLGAREIINRMQLTPVSCGVFSTSAAAVRVELFLNSRVNTGTFVPVGGSSLAQYATHGTSGVLSGGECIFTFFAPAGSVSSQDLSKVRDLGTSILGGGNTLAYPTTPLNIYPDGPDVLTLCVTPLAANAVVAARINWSEAQA